MPLPTQSKTPWRLIDVFVLSTACSTQVWWSNICYYRPLIDEHWKSKEDKGILSLSPPPPPQFVAVLLCI